MKTLKYAQHEPVSQALDSDRPRMMTLRPLAEARLSMGPHPINGIRVHDGDTNFSIDQRQGERRVLQETVLERSRRQLRERRQTGMDMMRSEMSDEASEGTGSLQLIKSLFC